MYQKFASKILKGKTKNRFLFLFESNFRNMKEKYYISISNLQICHKAEGFKAIQLHSRIGKNYIISGRGRVGFSEKCVKNKVD